MRAGRRYLSDTEVQIQRYLCDEGGSGNRSSADRLQTSSRMRPSTCLPASSISSQVLVFSCAFPLYFLAFVSIMFHLVPDPEHSSE